MERRWRYRELGALAVRSWPSTILDHAARESTKRVFTSSSGFRDVPALAGVRIDKDPHVVAARRVDEDLARRPKARFDRLARPLSAAGSRLRVGALRGGRTVSLPLGRHDDDQERPDCD